MGQIPGLNQKNMINKIKPIWYLIIGVVIMSATHLTYNVDLMAWIASVPFLIYLSLTQGLKSRLLFALALFLAWSFLLFPAVMTTMEWIQYTFTPFASWGVAAVGTDSQVSGFPLPSKESNERIKSTLFKRTRMAAKSDAKLIVWNEAATFILPAAESIWNDSLTTLATELKISLVASYL